MNAQSTKRHLKIVLQETARLKVEHNNSHNGWQKKKSAPLVDGPGSATQLRHAKRISDCPGPPGSSKGSAEDAKQC